MMMMVVVVLLLPAIRVPDDVPNVAAFLPPPRAKLTTLDGAVLALDCPYFPALVDLAVAVVVVEDGPSAVVVGVVVW